MAAVEWGKFADLAELDGKNAKFLPNFHIQFGAGEMPDDEPPKECTGHDASSRSRHFRPSLYERNSLNLS